jgi:hypothetical protein
MPILIEKVGFEQETRAGSMRYPDGSYPAILREKVACMPLPWPDDSGFSCATAGYGISARKTPASPLM